MVYFSRFVPRHLFLPQSMCVDSRGGVGAVACTGKDGRRTWETATPEVRDSRTMLLDFLLAEAKDGDLACNGVPFRLVQTMPWRRARRLGVDVFLHVQLAEVVPP